MKILIIDTARKNLSISIVDEERCLFSAFSEDENSHAKNIAQEINKMATQLKNGLNEISAVAINRGPGSFTGLRVGTSSAKGICYALDIPLIAIDGLAAHGEYLFRALKADYTDIFVLLDARRANYFYSHISGGKEKIKSDFKHISEIEQLIKGSSNPYIYNFSNKDDIKLRSEHYRQKVISKYIKGEFVDIQNFEPDYLLNNYRKK